MWKILTVKRRKRELAQRIEQLKERVLSLKSGDLNIVNVIKDAQINDKFATSSRQLFLSHIATSNAVVKDVKSIYLDIID